MTERNTATTGTRRSAKSASGEASGKFTDEERAAAKERARELKTAARRGGRASQADGERDVLEKIAEMGEADRVMAERIHAIVTANAPDLTPRTWVRHAGVRQGRQRRLLLPARAEVQGEVRDARLQR